MPTPDQSILGGGQGPPERSVFQPTDAGQTVILRLTNRPLPALGRATGDEISVFSPPTIGTLSQQPKAHPSREPLPIIEAAKSLVITIIAENYLKSTIA